jgi:hypothetical protein
MSQDTPSDLNRERLASAIRLQQERILASNHLIAEARRSCEKLVEEHDITSLSFSATTSLSYAFNLVLGISKASCEPQAGTHVF